MSALYQALQDNKEPPIRFGISSKFAGLISEDEENAHNTWGASWNASGTSVAVTSNGFTRLAVYNLKTRHVRLAMFCHAKCGPLLGVRLESLDQQCSLELQLQTLHTNLFESCLTALPAV